jgi:hypothetical protein
MFSHRMSEGAKEAATTASGVWAKAGQSGTNEENTGNTTRQQQNVPFAPPKSGTGGAPSKASLLRVNAPLTVHEAQAAIQDVATIRGRMRLNLVKMSSTTIVLPAAASAALVSADVTTRAQSHAAVSFSNKNERGEFSLFSDFDDASHRSGGASAAVLAGDVRAGETISSLTTPHQRPGRLSTTAKKSHASGAPSTGGGARDFNYELCCACGTGGELVCCESCPNAYHFSCTFPTLDPDNLPDGDWFCRHCAAKASAAALPLVSSRLAYHAVIGALAFVNPIEFTVPPELSDLVAARAGLEAAALAAPEDNPFFMAPDGDMLAKDRDVCVVCDLPFECDSSIQPAGRFDVPAIAGVAGSAPSAQPSAQGLAFLGAVDPYRSGERAVAFSHGDKRVCAWCDDTYHSYCVRPLSDPGAPVPTHWLCPRHFREPDANFARQKLSRKAHALHQDPKWHRDYLAQRETQARASAAPLLFGALKPSATLRGAASSDRRRAAARRQRAPRLRHRARAAHRRRHRAPDRSPKSPPTSAICARRRSELRGGGAATVATATSGAARFLDAVGDGDDELAEPAKRSATPPSPHSRRRRRGGCDRPPRRARDAAPNGRRHGAAQRHEASVLDAVIRASRATCDVAADDDERVAAGGGQLARAVRRRTPTTTTRPTACRLPSPTSPPSRTSRSSDRRELAQHARAASTSTPPRATCCRRHLCSSSPGSSCSCCTPSTRRRSTSCDARR